MPPDPDAGLLSLVIPVYNENESLKALFAEIAEVAKGLDVRVEVHFVDDGSTDGSWETIRELAGSDDRVRGIRFRALRQGRGLRPGSRPHAARSS